MLHGILSTVPGSASTLPRCFSRRKERRLTAGLWLAQAHAYAMALAGVLPGPAALVTRRCLSSQTSSRTLPSFTVDECSDPPPRTSWSLTLLPLPPGSSQLTNSFVRLAWQTCFASTISIVFWSILVYSSAFSNTIAAQEEAVVGSAESLVGKVSIENCRKDRKLLFKISSSGSSGTRTGQVYRRRLYTNDVTRDARGYGYDARRNGSSGPSFVNVDARWRRHRCYSSSAVGRCRSRSRQPTADSSAQFGL